MFVIKRDGRKQPVHFDKITSRIKKLCYGLHSLVDPAEVAQKVPPSSELNFFPRLSLFCFACRSLFLCGC
jgi:hypothetical protein